jgi:hypothetical protein
MQYNPEAEQSFTLAQYKKATERLPNACRNWTDIARDWMKLKRLLMDLK